MVTEAFIINYNEEKAYLDIDRTYKYGGIMLLSDLLDKVHIGIVGCTCFNEFTLVEDLIKAINELPNCPNGNSDVYDKRRIMYMVKTTPSRYVELDVEETR